MPSREAIIDGYVRDWREGGRAKSADERERQAPRQAVQSAGSMVPEYSPVRSSVNAVDASSSRHVNNGQRGNFRRRSASETLDTVLTVACYAAWGGLLIAIPVVVLVKAVSML